MNVRELRAALEPFEGELTVFFRCIAPFVGNVREVDVVKKDTFSTFGEEDACVILDIETEEDRVDLPPLDPEFVERTTKEVKRRISKRECERLIAKEILEDKASLDALPERNDEFVHRARIHRLQGKIAMAGMDLAALVMAEEV